MEVGSSSPGGKSDENCSALAIPPKAYLGIRTVRPQSSKGITY